jgi:hypothetical protein
MASGPADEIARDYAIKRLKGILRAKPALRMTVFCLRSLANTFSS